VYFRDRAPPGARLSSTEPNGHDTHCAGPVSDGLTLDQFLSDLKQKEFMPSSALLFESRHKSHARRHPEVKRHSLPGIHKLHLGCGPGPQPDGWIHLDGSWNARFAKIPRLRKLVEHLRLVPEHALEQAWQPDIVVANLRRRLPFAEDSFEAVYSSHVLEHLYEAECVGLLRECVRILRPGGVLRVVIPDLRAMVNEYLDRKSTSSTTNEPLPADWFNEALLFRTNERSKGFLIHRIYAMLTEFHTHKWSYDAESLAYRMTAAGLSDVEERCAWNSRIEDIAAIEKPERLEDGAGVCVEGVKPRKCVPSLVEKAK
jgi:predicted SAM-dependent methyltransferase